MLLYKSKCKGNQFTRLLNCQSAIERENFLWINIKARHCGKTRNRFSHLFAFYEFRSDSFCHSSEKYFFAKFEGFFWGFSTSAKNWYFKHTIWIKRDYIYAGNFSKSKFWTVFSRAKNISQFTWVCHRFSTLLCKMITLTVFMR